MIKKSKLLLFSLFAMVASILLSSSVFAFSVGENIGREYYYSDEMVTYHDAV